MPEIFGTRMKDYLAPHQPNLVSITVMEQMAPMAPRISEEHRSAAEPGGTETRWQENPSIPRAMASESGEPAHGLTSKPLALPQGRMEVHGMCLFGSPRHFSRLHLT